MFLQSSLEKGWWYGGLPLYFYQALLPVPGATILFGCLSPIDFSGDSDEVIG